MTDCSADKTAGATGVTGYVDRTLTAHALKISDDEQAILVIPRTMTRDEYENLINWLLLLSPAIIKEEEWSVGEGLTSEEAQEAKTFADGSSVLHVQDHSTFVQVAIDGLRDKLGILDVVAAVPTCRTCECERRGTAGVEGAVGPVGVEGKVMGPCDEGTTVEPGEDGHC